MKASVLLGEQSAPNWQRRILLIHEALLLRRGRGAYGGSSFLALGAGAVGSVLGDVYTDYYA
ncbi:MAG: hypothetical protein ACRYG7_12970 [Janthinobacterium lividum]